MSGARGARWRRLDGLTERRDDPTRAHRFGEDRQNGGFRSSAPARRHIASCDYRSRSIAIPIDARPRVLVFTASRQCTSIGKEAGSETRAPRRAFASSRLTSWRCPLARSHAGRIIPRVVGFGAPGRPNRRLQARGGSSGLWVSSGLGGAGTAASLLGKSATIEPTVCQNPERRYEPTCAYGFVGDRAPFGSRSGWGFPERRHNPSAAYGAADHAGGRFHVRACRPRRGTNQSPSTDHSSSPTTPAPGPATGPLTHLLTNSLTH